MDSFNEIMRLQPLGIDLESILTFLFVFIFLRKRKIDFISWEIGAPKKSGLLSLLGIGIVLLMTAFFWLFISSEATTNESATTQSPPFHSFWSIPSYLFNTLIFLTPIIIIMRCRRETIASAGVTSNNLGLSVLIGSVIGLITLFAKTGFGWLNQLTASHLSTLLYFGIVGVYEEFLFRGYLQTRLMRWLGGNGGWILASVIMALSHIFILYFNDGCTFLWAFIYSLYILPISLALGYFYKKTGNIAGPAIVHAFMDFVVVVIGLA